MSNQLSNQERTRLQELETQIESNVAMVGKALFEIRESRLYKDTHKTFEDYCQGRFSMSRNYINRQIQAAEVMNNLVPIGTIPKNEAQARPLASLPKEDQPAAWEKAQEIAKKEGKPVVARHVEKAVAEISSPPEPEGEIEPLVVDEVRPAKLPKYVHDDADRLWTLAKTDLDKILTTDRSRERVLREVIAYATQRIESKK